MYHSLYLFTDIFIFIYIINIILIICNICRRNKIFWHLEFYCISFRNIFLKIGAIVSQIIAKNWILWNWKGQTTSTLNDLAVEAPSRICYSTFSSFRVVKLRIRGRRMKKTEIIHSASPHWLMTEEAGSNEEDWNFVSINASFRDKFPYRADPPQVVYLSADRRPFGRTGKGTFYFIVSRL